MSDGRESGVGGRESGRAPAPGHGLPSPNASEAETEPIGLPPTPDPRPPTPGNQNWPLLYAAVLAELAVLIIIFYAFTKAFA